MTSSRYHYDNLVPKYDNEHIVYLDDIQSVLNADHGCDTEEQRKRLVSFAEQLRNAGVDPSRGFIIHEDGFQDFIEDEAVDNGEVSSGLITYVDWKRYADASRGDFSRVEIIEDGAYADFGGTWYYRA